MNELIDEFADVAIRGDWAQVKDAVMATAVTEKFRQNPALAEVLVSTDAATLVEHTRRDSYWGDGGNGSGKNMLGQVLMAVRALARTDRLEWFWSSWEREEEKKRPEFWEWPKSARKMSQTKTSLIQEIRTKGIRVRGVRGKAIVDLVGTIWAGYPWPRPSWGGSRGL